MKKRNNIGKKTGKQKNATGSVTCRASLASLDDRRRGVREQLLDRWGQSRPLYRRRPRSGGAGLYITRESLFRRGRGAAPESFRIGSTPPKHVTPARNLRDTRSLLRPAFSICLRGPLAPASPRIARTHSRYAREYRDFPPSNRTRRRCRPCGLQFSRLRNETTWGKRRLPCATCEGSRRYGNFSFSIVAATPRLFWSPRMRRWREKDDWSPLRGNDLVPLCICTWETTSPFLRDVSTINIRDFNWYSVEI